MIAFSMRAGILLVLAISTAITLAQPGGAPSVKSFSPEGEVRSIQQIAVRFSHDKVSTVELMHPQVSSPVLAKVKVPTW